MKKQKLKTEKKTTRRAGRGDRRGRRRTNKMFQNAERVGEERREAAVKERYEKASDAHLREGDDEHRHARR